MKPDRSWKALIKPGEATDFFITEKPLAPFIVTADYNLVNALILAELARLVYCNSVMQRRESLRRAGMVEVRFFNTNGTQAMLCYSESLGVAFLAFRGSSEIKDWIQNLKASLTDWPYGGKVHKGFKSAFDMVEDELWKAITVELAHPNCPLYICGHSLGGDLTELASSVWRPMAAYPFAPAPAGNQAFADSLAGIPIYRHTHGRDIVPTLLSTMKHVGELHSLDEIEFGWGWNSIVGPSPGLRCHIPLLYSCALERLL